MQVSMSNHKSTESAIKNLEIQVGQLAKQIADNSSSKFGANIENNPKEECKFVMTRGKMATMAEEEKDEKIVDRELVTELASEPEENFCELEEIKDEKSDQEKENIISKNGNEINDEKNKKKKRERRRKRKRM